MGGVVQQHEDIDSGKKINVGGRKGTVSTSDKLDGGSVVQIIQHRSNVDVPGRLDFSLNMKITGVQVLVTAFDVAVPEDVKGMVIVNETPADVALLFGAGIYPDSGNAGDWPVYIAPINELVDSIDLTAKNSGDFITSVDYGPVRGGSPTGTALNFMFILSKGA